VEVTKTWFINAIRLHQFKISTSMPFGYSILPTAWSFSFVTSLFASTTGTVPFVKTAAAIVPYRLRELMEGGGGR